MHTDLQYNLITLDTDHESISNESSSQSCLSTTSSSDPLISNLTQTLNDLNFSNISLQDKIVDEVFNSLVDHIAFGICFDTLREKTTTTPMVALKIPQPFANQVQKTGPQHKKNKKKMFDNSSLDIFGNSLNGVRKLECVCPNCERSLAASRLAPHLEKCMGMGRNSSRLASKRIAHFIKNSNGASSE